MELAYQIYNEPILGGAFSNPRRFTKEMSAYPLKNLQFALAHKALA